MKTILIIEDDPNIHEMLKVLLLQNDYEVKSAYSGTEALLVHNQTVDLILLDLMLPGKSGEDIICELKRIHPVPIIVTSALSDLEKNHIYNSVAINKDIDRVLETINNAEISSSNNDKLYIENINVNDLNLELYSSHNIFILENNDLEDRKNAFDSMIYLKYKEENLINDNMKNICITRLIYLLEENLDKVDSLKIEFEIDGAMKVFEM